MKFALVVNLSKERAIKYAKKISLFLLDKNAEIAMIEECSQYFKGIHIHYSKNITELFEYCDMAITVGGDGTIIHAAKYAAKAINSLSVLMSADSVLPQMLNRTNMNSLNGLLRAITQQRREFCLMLRS